MNILGAVIHRSKKVRIIMLTVLIATALLAGAGGYLLLHNDKHDLVSDNKTESTTVISLVNKLYLLPNGQPTVAAVRDVSKLNGQAFFKDAHDGDYLLVYSSAKIALLYRKSVNKLINVGPVNLGNNADAQSSQQR